MMMISWYLVHKVGGDAMLQGCFQVKWKLLCVYLISTTESQFHVREFKVVKIETLSILWTNLFCFLKFFFSILSLFDQSHF